MNAWVLKGLLATSIGALFAPQASNPQQSTASSPPVAPVRPVTDNYYGTKVVDPYRYMENLRDPEVLAWMKAQNDYTRAVLAKIPGRLKLLERMRELGRSTTADVTDVRRLPGEVYFYQKRLPGEDSAKLYMRTGLSGGEKLVADPEKIQLSPSSSSKGKPSFDYYVPSPDGKAVIVCIIPGGSEDDAELHVIEVASGRETDDVILHARLGYASWLPDSRSFVYGKLENAAADASAADRYSKYRAYLHVLKIDPDKDAAVFGYGVSPTIKFEERDHAFISVPPGSEYVLGMIDNGPRQRSTYYVTEAAGLQNGNAKWRKVADSSDQVGDIAVHGDDLYLLTFSGAPRFKVVRTDARKPDLGHAETIVPAGEAVVSGIFAAQDALYVQLLDGGISRLLRLAYGPKGSPQPLSLPFYGTISGAVSEFGEPGFNDPRAPGVVFRMAGWTKAPKIYFYDSQTKQVSDTKLQPVGPYDDPGNLEAVEVKVRSYDGTMVPLSIVYAKGLKRDGSNPTHLDGYGAYGRSQTPYFERTNVAFYERGAIWATCHVRGGGEYGEEWHQAGKGPTKPNTWRDFIACAEYLIDQKYTSPAHLSGFGGSAGGITIGRAMSERPDLFGAAMVFSGAVDMLRMETTVNGPGNIEEFGSTKTPEGFKALYEMSALQHVKDGTAYPAVLVAVGMNDPRTEPWFGAKLTARLQAATTSGKPVLLRVEYGVGHQMVSGYDEGLMMLADLMSFDLWRLGAPEFQPSKE